MSIMSSSYVQLKNTVTNDAQKYMKKKYALKIYKNKNNTKNDYFVTKFCQFFNI